MMQDFKKSLPYWIGIVLMLGAFSLTACAGPQKLRQPGRCFNWNSIQRTSAKAILICNARKRGTAFYCTRAVFHTGKHHDHRESCVMTWRSE